MLLVDRVIAKYITGGDHHGIGKKGNSEGHGPVEMAEGTATRDNETANGVESAQKP